MPKTLKIRDKVVKFKVSAILWKRLRVRYGRATSKELRNLIIMDLKTEKLWLECKGILDQLELKTTKIEFIQVLMEKWLRDRKREA